MEVTAATVEQSTPRKKRGSAPTTGQSGPPIELSKDRLNDKETKIVAALASDVNPLTIIALAVTCFGSEVKANSWVRNSLRRLVRGKWVEKVGAGTYRLSDEGRSKYETVSA